MSRLIASAALLAMMALGAGPGHAQPPHAGQKHVMDEARMADMMKTMGDMQEQMKGMQGTRTMMEQHRGQMMQHCPAASAPSPPK